MQLPLMVAAAAAVEAGRFFRTRLHEKKDIRMKSSPTDLVTDVDAECERRIRAHIHGAMRDHAVLGEESTQPGAAAAARAVHDYSTAPHLWIVDPLDGTTNFVQRMPLSVVSIAYAQHGVVMVGVVYDPYRDELFYAARGQGAYVCAADTALAEGFASGSTWPSERLSVSSTASLRASIVATGLPTRGEYRERTTEAGLRLLGKVKSFRALGAAALHLAYVAAGRIDAFWEYDLNAWDMAAGTLLVQEAGGCVQRLGGGPYELTVRDVIAAASPGIADELNQCIACPPADEGGALR